MPSGRDNRPEGDGTYAPDLYPDSEGCGSLQDHDQYRTARLLHDEAGLHGGDARVLRFTVPAYEYGHRKHVYRRAESGEVSGAIRSQREPRAHQGREREPCGIA